MGFTELASVDGRITPTAEAVVPLKDDGLYRGDGVFEVVRIYQDRPFALIDHLDRMVASADRLHLEFDRAALERDVEALLGRAAESAPGGDGEQTGGLDAQMRLITTRGGRRIAALEPIANYGETIPVATVRYAPTLILNGVKSLSYAANMHATRLARETGAEEAVLVTPEGKILEPPTSGIFWVNAEGELRTTELGAGILASITRERVMRDLEAETGHWPLEDMLGGREAFLVSSTREVQGVSTIDGQELSETAPGPVTREARRLLAERIARELDGAATGGTDASGAGAGAATARS